MRKKSIGLRLTLSIWLLLLAAMVPSYLYFSRAVGREIAAEAEARAVSALDLTAWLMASHAPFADDRSFDAWAHSLGERLGLRITFIVGGRVIADSDVLFDDIPGMETHEFRVEVARALDGGLGVSVRHSETLGQDMLYAARKVDAPPGLRGENGVLRLAVPFSGVKDRLSRLDAAMFLVFAVSLILAGLLGLAVSRRLSASIRALSNAAATIGRGDRGQRIHVYPGEEFAPLVRAFNELSEDVREQRATVEDQKWQLDALFNAMAEGVAVLDARGRILSSNRMLKAMFPAAETGLGRHHLETLGRPEVQALIEAAAGDADQGGARETHLEFPDGRILHLRVVSLRDLEGVIKIIAVFRDVSESLRLERVRRDFVANVSHELKTPVTSIKGYAETLLDSPDLDPEARERFLKVILGNADHMTRIVTGLLTLARTQNRPENAPLSPTDPLAAARESLAAIAPLASRKNVVLADELPRELPAVRAEADGLREILGNLLDNAVKFSPEGGVVRLGARRGEDGLTLFVADQGPGVAREDRFRIFERFVRLGPGGGKEGSAGLGLAIVRRLVEGYGGRVAVEDAPAGTGGAVFSFTLILA